MKPRLPILILSLPIFAACERQQTAVAHRHWYEHTKSTILEQAGMAPDSIAYSYNEDSTHKVVEQYHDKHLLSTRGFDHDILRYEIFYSIDRDFEFRRERCENGNPAFEGLFYKNEGYGITTWFAGNRLKEQGVRFKNNRVGIWKLWTKENMEPEEKNYGGDAAIESFPVLKHP
ncbi:hypothetical protein [Chitinophaga sp. Cy-1792]|uniref:hypothetical protein n=1 Tax=Chitinophaga sp. Cy-1792 TaxID=2608339 RepID=UPI00141F59C6|nr:hypothetical protein [Chitinophaga sp. Cy-1792]NIG55825.1 hypothetical protein [Chitinophaga sp. Cy-1792]